MVSTKLPKKAKLVFPIWPVGYSLIRLAEEPTNLKILHLGTKLDFVRVDEYWSAYSGSTIYVDPSGKIEHRACPEMWFGPTEEYEQNGIIKCKDIVPGGYALFHFHLFRSFCQKEELCQFLQTTPDRLWLENSHPNNPTYSQMIEFLNSPSWVEGGD